MSASLGIRVDYGTTFLALLAFIVSFFGARIFTTLHPDAVLVSGGVHFHHFWYGLAMVVATGWLGIVANHPALDRVYATVFGLGGGLMGDEVGLLLTFGDYQSELTYDFFVGFVSAVVLILLVLRFGEPLKRDLADVERGEALVHLGVVVGGLSALFFAFGFWIPGSGLALAGAAIAISGVASKRAHDPLRLQSA
ncbi:MAG TPA: hypothetical protein VLU99_04580 [Nitrososphaerales archaeon]|nr:hypothetical protein [Nitrososphaerales archaeon]HUK75047.1 hypothetical protein [Nitrososphaerales archaeon]